MLFARSGRPWFGEKEGSVAERRERSEVLKGGRAAGDGERYGQGTHPLFP